MNDRFDTEMDNMHGYGYSTATITQQAIEKAGSADPADVRDSLRNEIYPDHILAMPPVNYNSKGTNENAVAGVYQLQDGELATVLPEQFRKSSIISPKPNMG